MKIFDQHAIECFNVAINKKGEGMRPGQIRNS